MSFFHFVLRLNDTSLFVGTTFCLIYSSVDEDFDFFISVFLAVMNYDAVTIHVCFFV